MAVTNLNHLTGHDLYVPFRQPVGAENTVLAVYPPPTGDDQGQSGNIPAW